MNLLTSLRNFLYDPRVRNVDVDDAQLLAIHSTILQQKPLLRSAFETFYGEMLTCCDQFLLVEGLEIELGSGAGFFKSMRPDLLTSDVRLSPDIDLVIDAQAMELADESVRCIYAINVFHHLPDPGKFIEELTRVLKPGGGCILVEPHVGLGSRMLHRHLHRDEHFDPLASEWANPQIGGPLSGANQALAHIVFQRDRLLFEQKFGTTLEIAHQHYLCNGLRYFLSGGLNFRQLAPSVSLGPLIASEWLLSPLARYWSFHQLTLLRKRM